MMYTTVITGSADFKTRDVKAKINYFNSNPSTKIFGFELVSIVVSPLAHLHFQCPNYNSLRKSDSCENIKLPYSTKYYITCDYHSSGIEFFSMHLVGLP